MTRAFILSSSSTPGSVRARFVRTLFLLMTFISTSLIATAQAQADPAAIALKPANVTFTTIDVPGAVATSVYGINSYGEMVGSYTVGNNEPSIGFLYSGGNFSSLVYPGLYDTYAQGINDSGVIAGSAANQGGPSVGFLYSGGTFSTIRVPGQPDTSVYGINNAGDLAGGADSGVTAAEAFERIGTRFKNVTPPPGGFVAANSTGINNLGEIVGWYTSNITTSFAYEGGKFITITVPGSNGLTGAWGINDSGIVVGWYEECISSDCFHGFVFMKGKYVSLNYPGATATFAFGIGNSGQIVGTYTLDNTIYHGFLTSPITAKDFEEPDCCEIALDKP